MATTQFLLPKRPVDPDAGRQPPSADVRGDHRPAGGKRAGYVASSGVEWLGQADVQIGAYDADPPAQVAPFLAGFVEGLAAHPAVLDARLLAPDAVSPVPLPNPTRRIRFRFLAESDSEAERLVSGELRSSGVRAAVDALDEDMRQVGWMLSVDFEPT